MIIIALVNHHYDFGKTRPPVNSRSIVVEVSQEIYSRSTVLIMVVAIHSWDLSLHLCWYEYNLIFEVEYLTHLCLGTAMGDLGRHTKIGPDGMPIVDHIFMQVCYVGAPYQVAKNGWVQISYASAMTTKLTFGLTKLSFLLF